MYIGANMIKHLLSYIPHRLPVGMSEFHSWSESIIRLLPSGLENVPDDDKKFVIASAIQRLDPTANYKPKRYFVKLLHKAAASQIAGQIFVEIKEKQKAALEVTKVEQPTEVTASQVVS